MTADVLVDTNVLLYAHDLSEPIKRPRARAWIDRLWVERTGRLSAQVLSEFYFNATRKLRPGLTPDAAWRYVLSFRAWNPQPIDADLLARARELEQRHRLNWWDALIVGAAQLQACSILLTEDLQDGAVYDGVTVRSPFTLGVGEVPARYQAIESVVSRHPPRGRPKGSRRRTVPAPG